MKFSKIFLTGLGYPRSLHFHLFFSYNLRCNSRLFRSPFQKNKKETKKTNPNKPVMSVDPFVMHWYSGYPITGSGIHFCVSLHFFFSQTSEKKRYLFQ